MREGSKHLTNMLEEDGNYRFGSVFGNDYALTFIKKLGHFVFDLARLAPSIHHFADGLYQACLCRLVGLRLNSFEQASVDSRLDKNATSQFQFHQGRVFRTRAPLEFSRPLDYGNQMAAQNLLDNPAEVHDRKYYKPGGAWLKWRTGVSFLGLMSIMHLSTC
jgi:hypothetical protein